MKQYNKESAGRLARIKCWLLDMDGTVTLGEEALPGAQPFFKSIENQRYIFLTNNSSHSKSHYLNRLTRIGIPVTSDQVLTSTDALALYLRHKKPDASTKTYPVGTPGFEHDLEQGGIKLVKKRGESIDYVVLGFDTSLVYEKLDIACDYIRRGVPYLATNPDRVCPLAGGRVLPDCGALIAFMKTCTEHEPEQVIGKPETTMIEMVLDTFGFEREDCAMVGDRIYTDLATASRAEILSVAVLSGEATREAIEQSDIHPDFIFQDIGELADAIHQAREPDK
jgi:HAD superfamily hydrolase (TIGR01450 family)